MRRRCGFRCGSLEKETEVLGFFIRVFAVLGAALLTIRWMLGG